MIAAVAAGVALAASGTSFAARLSIDQGQHAAHAYYIAAPGESNDVRITVNGSHFNVRDSGATITVTGPTSGEFGYCVSVDAHHAYCKALGAMVNWVVRLGDKNDKFFLSEPTELSTDDVNEIWGDAGDDTIQASAWIEMLHGGDGNDTLVTTDKWCDRFYGDAGDDVFRSSQKLACNGGSQGGPGSDTFDFSNRSEAVTATAGSAQYAGIENFIGGSGNDSLTGDAGPNRLVGGPGNDVLTGLGGDDSFDPGTGRDRIGGGDGVDTVTYAGRTSPVSLSDDGQANDGQSGENDTIGTDVENMVGGRAADTLRGNAADNVLNGGPGGFRTRSRAAAATTPSATRAASSRSSSRSATASRTTERPARTTSSPGSATRSAGPATTRSRAPTPPPRSRASPAPTAGTY